MSTLFQAIAFLQRRIKAPGAPSMPQPHRGMGGQARGSTSPRQSLRLREPHIPEGPDFSQAVKLRVEDPYLAAAGWSGGAAVTTELPSLLPAKSLG